MRTARQLPDGRWVVPDNRWDLLDGRSPRPAPHVSVIVPYFQAQTRLDLVLTALALQTHPASRLEVVVADDGSATAPRIPPAAAGLDVRVVRQPDRGFRAGAARNLGARHSSGEVLCFLDGDTVPEPDYVERMARLPALLPDALVTGRRRHADLRGWTPARLTTWLLGTGQAPAELGEPQWLVELSAGGLLDADDGSYRAVISAVMACSAELFTEVGGFDESFTGYGGEDWELAHRMLTAGAVLAHERTATGWHDGPDWAGRTRNTADARAQKQAESLALAQRVPEPGARTGHGWFPLPDVAVQLRGRGAVSATVCSLLDSRGVDLGVWVDGVDLDELDHGLAGDPRVHPGAPAVPVLESCRTVVTVPAPCLLGPDTLSRVVDQVRPGGAGELRLHVAGGRQLRVSANRALHRARRWAGRFGVTDDELVAELFGVRDLGPAEAAALGVH